MPTHMKVLAVVLIGFAAIVLALSLNALIPHTVEAPGAGTSPLPSVSTSASASSSPSASPS